MDKISQIQWSGGSESPCPGLSSLHFPPAPFYYAYNIFFAYSKLCSFYLLRCTSIESLSQKILSYEDEMMGVVALGVQRAIANIEARLRGVVVGVGAAPSLPLSVEGQAHRLISEAVSHTNLAKMYIWWMAWF